MKFKTEQGEVIELTEEEFVNYPFNSKLTLIKDEVVVEETNDSNKKKTKRRVN